MRERVDIVISEINKCIRYIEKNNLFKQEYLIEFKNVKLFKKSINNEKNIIAKNFFTNYLYILGEFYIGSNTIVLESIISKEFEDLNKNIDFFDFNKNILSEKTEKVDNQENFIHFLIGKQIGCINRALCLNIKENYYCMESFKKITEMTINLLKLFENKIEENSKETYEEFYKKNEEVIKSKKVKATINGLFNYYHVYGVIMDLKKND